MKNNDDMSFAGGGLVWQYDNGELNIAVVHRPKYDDWSLPKGKAKNDLDSSLEDTAIRETTEETGWEVEIIDFAGEVSYPNKGKIKMVRFWNMRPKRKTGEPDPEEIDRVRWLAPEEAARVLSYEHDRKLVEENYERILKIIPETGSK